MTLLKCFATPGQFSDEYAISCNTHNGVRFSLFAPKSVVRCDSDSANALMHVQELEHRGDLVLIQLLSPTLENDDYFITVCRDQLIVN